jgi:PKD repeat protein
LFNGSSSSDPDGSIVSYAWQFGDGTTGFGVTTQHAYAVAGTYTVRLTVTDNDGATNTTTRQVVISAQPNQPPTASFNANPSFDLVQRVLVQ